MKNTKIYFIEFIFSAILTISILFIFSSYALEYLLANKKGIFTNILFTSLKSNTFFSISLVLILIFLSRALLSHTVTYLKKLFKTPIKYHYFYHGMSYGILIFAFYWIAIDIEKYQKLLFFKGDFLIISISFGVFWALIEMFESSKAVKNNNDKLNDKTFDRLFSEEPINHMDQDIIDYSKVINEICNILESPYNDKGKVIALYGRNGIGKTSILNLIRNRFKDDKTFRFVTFEPYRYNNHHEITKNFYESIKSLVNMDGFYPQLSDISNRFYELFYGITSKTFIGRYNLKKLIGGFIRRNTLDDLRNIVTEYLYELNIKGIVIIDNIDRCSIKHRYLLFQLINTIGKTKNLYYIIAASEEELLSTEEPQIVSLID